MIIQKLESYIYEGNIEDAIKIVKFIGETKDEAYLIVLIKYLKNTEDKLLRNEIAIALSDIGNNEAVDPLIEILINSKTKGSRGTLLYALENLDYIAHIGTITSFIDDTSIEVSMQSFLLFELVADKLSYDEKEECRNIIESKLKNTENELLEEALELLK